MPTPAFRRAYPEYSALDDETLTGLLATRGIDPRVAAVRRLYPGAYGDLDDAALGAALDARGMTEIPIPAETSALPDDLPRMDVVETGSWGDVPARMAARGQELASGVVSAAPPEATADLAGFGMEALAGRIGGVLPPELAAAGAAAGPEEIRGLQREVRGSLPEVAPDPFPGLAGVEAPGAWDVTAAAAAHPAQTVGWALRQGLASAPDMAAALLSFPAYAVALSGLMAEERAESQGVADPTSTDRAIGALGGAVSAALGRAGAQVLFRGLPAPLRTRLTGGGDTLAGRLTGDVAGRTLGEGVIEGAQSGVEALARGAGTPAGIEGIGGEMVMGGIGGLGAGGAIGAPAAGVEHLYLAPRRQVARDQLAAQAEAEAAARAQVVEGEAEAALRGARPPLGIEHSGDVFTGTDAPGVVRTGRPDTGFAPPDPDMPIRAGWDVPRLPAPDGPRRTASLEEAVAAGFEQALDGGMDPEQALAMALAGAEPDAPYTWEDAEADYEADVEHQIEESERQGVEAERQALNAQRAALEGGMAWDESEAEYERVLNEVLGALAQEVEGGQAERGGQGRDREGERGAAAGDGGEAPRADGRAGAVPGPRPAEDARAPGPVAPARRAEPPPIQPDVQPREPAQPPAAPRVEPPRAPEAAAPADVAPGPDLAPAPPAAPPAPAPRTPLAKGRAERAARRAEAAPPDTAQRTTEPTAPGDAHVPSVEDMGPRVATARVGGPERQAVGQGQDRTERVRFAAEDDAEPKVKQTAGGERYPVRYGVVELDDLNWSHTFRGERRPQWEEAHPDLQPRTGRESRAAIGKSRQMYRDFNPDFLGEQPQAGHGAPIVGRDLSVEGGHGRTALLEEVYAKGGRKQRAYTRMVGRWARGEGVDVSGMRRPVLVAVRQGEADRAAVARATNEQELLEQTAGERAGEDAERMGLRVLANTPMRDQEERFKGIVGSGAGWVSDEGTLTQAGRNRLDAARFHAAWGAGLTKARKEDLDEGLRTTLNAAGAATANVLHARYHGAPDADVAKVVDAVDAVLQWRRKVMAGQASKKFLDWAEEPDMFGPGPVPDLETRQIADSLAGASTKVQTDVLRALARELAARGMQRTQGDLVGGRADVPLAQVAQEAGKGDQATLFRGRAEAYRRGGTAGTAHRPEAEREGLQPGERPSGATDLRRRQGIVSSFAKAIGAGVYTGRIYRKGTAGYTRPATGEVRIRRSGDAETAAHEIAHLVDVRTWGKWKGEDDYVKARPHMRNARIRAEMESLSYDKDKPWEGWAEFVRTYMTQPEHAKRVAPTATAWMDRWIGSKRNPAGKPFRDAAKELRDWYTADPVEQARTKIGPERTKRQWESERKGWPQRIRDAAWSIRQRLTDDLAGAERMMMESGQRRGGDAFERAQLSRAASSIVEEALTRGVPVRSTDANGNEITRFAGKGLVEVLRPVAGKDYDDFMLYVVGRSAAELRGQGRENLFSGTQIEAMQGLAEGRPHFEQAAADLQAWFKGLTDFAIATGLISERQRAGWQRDFYIPFYRETSPGAGRPKRDAERVGGDSGIRRLRGGEGNLRDISANLVQNAQSMIETSLVNEARRGLVDSALEAPESARWLVRLGKRPALLGKVDTDGIVSSVGAALRSQLGEVDAAPALDALKAWAEEKGDAIQAWALVNDPKRIPGERIVAVIRKGEVEFYEIAPDSPAAEDFFQSMARVKPPARGTFIRNLNRGRRAFQGTITMSANFVLRNFWRDTWQAWAHSKTGFKPVVSSLKGAWKVLSDSPEYQAYLAAGGMAGTQSTDPDSAREALQAAAKRMGARFPLSSIVSPMAWVRTIEKVNWAFEAAARVEEFSRGRARGMSEAEAAYAARDFANYSLRGDLAALNLAKDNIPFLSAGWVGLDKAWRGLTREQKGKMATAYAMRLAYYGVAGTALYGLTRGNPLIVEAEDWEKDAYLLLPLPKPGRIEEYARGTAKPTESLSQKEAGERYEVLRIPKSWEMGSVMSVGQRMMDAAATGKWGEEMRHVPSILASNFRFDWMPWYVRPFAEAGKPWGEKGGGTNVHAFTGRPVEGVGMEKLPPGMRAGPSTSPAMTALGRATLDLPFGAQISPARAEHIGRGLLNAFWTAGNAVATQAFYRDESPAIDWRRLPLVSVGTRSAPGRTRRDAEFYQWYREALTAAAGFDKMAKSTRRPSDATLMRYARGGAMAPQLRTIARQLSNIRKSRRQIREHPTMGRKEKQQRDWDLARRYNDLMIQIGSNPGLREAVGARP